MLARLNRLKLARFMMAHFHVRARFLHVRGLPA
jgi:hypothetical protein